MVIPGLGALSEHIAVSPAFDAAKTPLSPEEQKVVEIIGRAAEIKDVITKVDQDSNLTIAALLSLRARGVIVKARVTRPEVQVVDTAMLEQIDLDDAKKRDILELEKRLESANLFEILGVPLGSDAAAAKSAFFELSRKFHPDRYFGKNLGSFRQRVEKNFKRLSDAHQTLTNEDKRKAYLAKHPELARAPAPPPPPPAAPASTGSSSRDLKAVVEAAAPEPPPPPDPKREAERRERMKKHPYLARHARVHDLLDRAKEAIAKGDFAAAHIDLVTASQGDERNVEIRQLLADVKKKADAQRSAAEFEKAAKLESANDLQAALNGYRSASNIDNKNARAAYAVARLMYRYNLDPKEITSYAQRAVEGDPRHVEAHVLLGKLYDMADMKQMAKRHYEQAHRIDPNNADAKKAVKGRWPF
jgi:curved DNA-binding protein CbpA